MAFPALVIATSWNVNVLVAVALNAEWALTRAAGGQFTSFPLSIRIIYGIEAIFMGAQIYFAHLLRTRNGAWSIASWRLGNFLVAIYGASTLLNALSRSTAERLNAPFALISMLAFLVLVGRDKPIN